jgi:hypothetical protein
VQHISRVQDCRQNRNSIVIEHKGWVFTVNDKKLVRVTDRELIRCRCQSDFSTILEKLGGCEYVDI